MDRETVNAMLKLKMAVRRAGGPEIDLVKLASDAAYADDIFRAVEALPDETLAQMVMKLRGKLDPLSANTITPEPVTQPTVETPDRSADPASRYIFGVRG